MIFNKSFEILKRYVAVNNKFYSSLIPAFSEEFNFDDNDRLIKWLPAIYGSKNTDNVILDDVDTYTTFMNELLEKIDKSLTDNSYEYTLEYLLFLHTNANLDDENIPLYFYALPPLRDSLPRDVASDSRYYLAPSDTSPTPGSRVDLPVGGDVLDNNEYENLYVTWEILLKKYKYHGYYRFKSHTLILIPNNSNWSDFKAYALEVNNQLIEIVNSNYNSSSNLFASYDNINFVDSRLFTVLHITRIKK